MTSVCRNASTSRLLLLPGELRNRIWEYASSYVCIHLNASAGDKLSALVGPRPGKFIRSAFCLPETCRQIYIETVTLAYSLNVFYIRPMVLQRAQIQFGTSAHRLAIRTVHIRSCDLTSMIYIRRNTYPPISSQFPGLRQLLVLDSCRTCGREKIQTNYEEDVWKYEGGKSFEIIWVNESGQRLQDV
jgi:hypothetical protein